MLPILHWYSPLQLYVSNTPYLACPQQQPHSLSHCAHLLQVEGPYKDTSKAVIKEGTGCLLDVQKLLSLCECIAFRSAKEPLGVKYTGLSEAKAALD